MTKKGKAPVDILTHERTDRLLLPHVPDPEGIRRQSFLRGTVHQDAKLAHTKEAGRRFMASFPVLAIGKEGRQNVKCVDISQSGILLQAGTEDELKRLNAIQEGEFVFTIPKGTMNEGMERKRIRARGVKRRSVPEKMEVAYEFSRPLSDHFRYREAFTAMVAMIALLVISLIVLLMRSESLLFLQFNRWTAVYSLMTAVFLLTRYLFGAFYRPVPVDREYTPGVTIIVPCFNEEEWIDRTITCCMDQDYPMDRLEVIIVDDASTDNSLEVIRRTVERLHEQDDVFHTQGRLSYMVQEVNQGKREAMARGIRAASHELVVVVDSDSFLEPDAIRNLVQPFKDDKIAGVSGRTDVANTYTNALTKMQSVRYYISFRVTKAAESLFDAVTCLSGPLSCYRKTAVMEVLDAWLGQSFLGNKATFGDDRSLTNFMLRNYRTGYQDTAVAYTIVPNTNKIFLRQQMRWKRSWLRETFIAATFMWKKEPFMSVFFYMGMLITILSPLIVLYNLIYVPIVFGAFPTVFVAGVAMMSLMMSLAQLFFRRSSTWLYGMLFNLYYVFVLIWQMPYAWVTFWKSSWGTRPTPEDKKKPRGTKAA